MRRFTSGLLPSLLMALAVAFGCNGDRCANNPADGRNDGETTKEIACDTSSAGVLLRSLVQLDKKTAEVFDEIYGSYADQEIKCAESLCTEKALLTLGERRQESDRKRLETTCEFTIESQKPQRDGSVLGTILKTTRFPHNGTSFCRTIFTLRQECKDWKVFRVQEENKFGEEQDVSITDIPGLEPCIVPDAEVKSDFSTPRSALETYVAMSAHLNHVRYKPLNDLSHKVFTFLSKALPKSRVKELKIWYEEHKPLPAPVLKMTIGEITQKGAIANATLHLSTPLGDTEFTSKLQYERGQWRLNDDRLMFPLAIELEQAELEDVVLPKPDDGSNDNLSGETRLLINICHDPDVKCPDWSPDGTGEGCRDASHWTFKVGETKYGDEELVAMLKKESNAKRDPATGLSEQTLMIRADKSAPYELIERVMMACSKAGIYKLEIGAVKPADADKTEPK